MEKKFRAIRLMIYAIGAYLFITSDFQPEWFDYAWFAVFSAFYVYSGWTESEYE